MKRPLPLLLLVTLLVTACASSPGAASARDASLISKDGSQMSFEQWTARSPYTVFVFVAKDCPCLDAHKDRLVELARAYGPRGVQFLSVDSEVGTTPEGAAREAERLGLRFPVLVDRGAVLANAFGAEYATFSVLTDATGRVLYAGGIDSDKRKLHDDATPYLQEVLEDVTAGKPPRRATGKALGCSLRKW